MAAAESKKITASDVAETLKSGYFLVTGSTTEQGFPIVFVLDGVNPEPTPDQQCKSLAYIASLPILSTDKNVHYIFIVDRRRSTWSSVRKVLSTISTAFTRLVKAVVLIQPSSFFQRRFSSESNATLQQDFLFELIVLEEVDSLLKLYGSDTIIKQMGGNVTANPEGFLQQRVSIDSLECNCVDLEERVKQLFLEDAQDDFDIPNDVASTEALLNEHKETKTNVTDEITNIRSQGEVISQCLRGDGESLSLHLQMLHLQEVQRLTARLEDMEEAIRDYWEKEEAKLQQCMRLREFHEEFRTLQYQLTKLVDAVNSVSEYVSTSDEAASNCSRLNKISNDSQAVLSRAKDLASEWTTHISEGNMFINLDTVTPKCEELKRLHEVCHKSLQSKLAKSDKQLHMYTNIEQALQWATEGLASLSEELPAEADAAELRKRLGQVDCHLTLGHFLEVANYEEFILPYEDVITDDGQRHIEEVHTKVTDVINMFLTKKNDIIVLLAQLEAIIPQPKGVMKAKRLTRRTTVKKQKEAAEKLADTFEKENSSHNASVNQSISPTSPHLSRNGSIKANSSKTDDSSSEQEVTSLSKISNVSSENESSSKKFSRQSSMSGSSTNAEPPKERKNVRARPGSIKKNIKGMFSRSSQKVKTREMNGTADDEPRARLFSKYLSAEEEQNLTLKRIAVMKELVETEEIYVRELSEIVKGYMKPIGDDADDDVPSELYLNQSVLFGNLEEIYDFHANIFIHELKEYMNSPSLVGSCFKSRMFELNKYNQYCTNKPKSEVILKQLVDDPYLLKCQQRTGHLLPLSAYLLKPVQRITKYELLLKEMLKYLGDDEEGIRDVTEALNSMVGVVKHVNNLMHQVAITGYDVKLSTHGRLVHQGKLLVSQDKKSSKLKNRQFFLFEKILVCCKVDGDVKTGSYDFKSAIVLSETTLEVPNNSSTRFTLRSASETWLMQTSSQEEHGEWLRHLETAMKSSSDATPESQQQPLRTGRRSPNITTPSPTKLNFNEDFVLEEDPDLDLFNSMENLTINTSIPKLSNSSSEEINGNSVKQFVLMEDYDNDLLLSKGDVVEMISTRKDMMQVKIPGTGISSWFPTNVLLPYIYDQI